MRLKVSAFHIIPIMQKRVSLHSDFSVPKTLCPSVLRFTRRWWHTGEWHDWENNICKRSNQRFWDFHELLAASEENKAGLRQYQQNEKSVVTLALWTSSWSNKGTGESDVYWPVLHRNNRRIKNQLNATCYFIVLLIDSTCFGHYYTHHQELATVMLITTLVVSFLVCWLKPATRTANQERNDQCGNQHHSRELLMMSIVMPETCWACKKYNKITSGI